MENLRNMEISNIGNIKIIAIRDYLLDQRVDLETTKIEKLNMPKSNVLYFELENNGWFCIRPSGTEPKIKIYMGVKEKELDKASTKIKCLKTDILRVLEEEL